jgi:hypothetical protein
MSQAYSDPTRADDPHALPNIEVFEIDYGLNVECLDDYHRCHVPGSETRGWYWWSCVPGCLPNSDLIGPFDTEADALADAREDALS